MADGRRNRAGSNETSHAVTLSYMTTRSNKKRKLQSSLQNINKQAMESRCGQTHRLRPSPFTYYGGLPLAKDTLLSLCPLEGCGCPGLEATRLARQPGEEEEEGKEEESREEVEEEAEEEELAGIKAQRLWPSGLYQEPLKSWEAPYL